MATPDMDVIKEIPGYKVIMKAILKSQIQQLVEQLAAHTEEESIILTASVSDGTLSHLGSDSGKSFLDDHEDVKSQFLGFCLKNHHRKKQKEKEREELERQRQIMAASPARYGPGPMGQRYSTPVGPRARFTPRQGNFAVRSIRHEPYPVSKPVKRTPQNAEPVMKLPIDGQSIKIEPQDDSSNQSTGDNNKDTSQPGSPGQTLKSENADEDNSSNSTIPNEGFSETQPAGGLGLDSDFSNLISEQSEGDPNVNIKMEDLSQSDDLEITGIEPGQSPMSSHDASWAQNQSMGYSPGASGSMLDMQGQEGYSMDESTDKIKFYACMFCNKKFRAKSFLKVHERIHTGYKPYSCKECGKTFTQKGNADRHYNIMHARVYTASVDKSYSCTECGKSFSQKEEVEHHYQITHAKST